MSRDHDLEQFLSNLIYHEPQKRRHVLNQSNYKHLFLTEFNDAEFASLIDPVSKTKYNIHRGTVNTDDLLTDSTIVTNTFETSDRFKRSLEKSQQSNARYNQYNTIETGHSLGGALAEDIAYKNNTQSVVFNRGSSPLSNYDHIDREKHIHYRTDDDLVSEGAKKGSRRRETTSSTYSKISEKIPNWQIAKIGTKISNWYHAHLLKNMV
jgi:hypothetical protein